MNVLVIPFFGMVSRYSLDLLHSRLRSAAAGAENAVVLHIQSPGGDAVGVPETARLIERVSSVKPVYAYTDYIMASAGYWLARAADKVYSSASAVVGSVGAYIEIFDYEKMYQGAGIEHTVFRGGDRKARWLDGQMDEQEKAALQESVSRSHAEFRAYVLSKRPQIDAKWLEGQAFSGTDAFEIGLTDGIYDSLDDLLTAILTDRR